ncbi:Uncharacterised protein [Mycobacteroides abscessus subsp. bolletii]|nr:Uncharacterised protein [Mycobacteroides abscessus subsp. bolletii]
MWWVVDLLAYPFTRFSLSADHNAGAVSRWLTTWLAGSMAAFTGLIGLTLLIYLGWRTADIAAEGLYQRAIRGVSLSDRRKFTRWLVRVDKWLRIVARAAGIVAGVGPRRPDREPLNGSVPHRRGRLARAVLRGLMAIPAFIRSVTNTWMFWLYTVAGATWAVNADAIRRRTESLFSAVRGAGVPVGVAALGFTMITFLAVNAVTWRRRALSKWRAEHLTQGYADMDRIRVHLAKVRTHLTPAIELWHATMSRSWDAACSPDRVRSSYFQSAYNGPWRGEFDHAHASWCKAVRKINKVISDRQRRDALALIVPWTTGAVVFRPGDLWGLGMFSPAFREQITEQLNKAETIRLGYYLAVDNALACALQQAGQSIKAETAEVLSDTKLFQPTEDADTANNYRDHVKPVLASGIAHVKTELRRQLGDALPLQRLVTKHQIDAKATSLYREALENAIAALDDGALEAAMARELQLSSLRKVAVDLNRVSAVLGKTYWDSVPAADKHQQRVDVVTACTQRAINECVTRKVRAKLDPVLNGGADVYEYADLLERQITAGCRAEAELTECLAAINKVLVPNSRWERLRAALNR